MDLGLRGRRAIVCASSRGLGRACATSLAREGVDVVINGRTAADVESTAAVLRADHHVTVREVTADVTTGAGRAALLEACPEPDILVLNGGGPQPIGFTAIDEDAWQAALASTMVSPLLLVADVIDGMRARGFGRIVAVTSAMVKSPNPFMIMSVAPRTGLTGALKALSKDVARDNVTINQLLPERFDTDRQEFMARRMMEIRGIGYEEARAEQVASIAAGRLGEPAEFGDACAFLCSAQAGYISGQNLQLDGGSYAGLL